MNNFSMRDKLSLLEEIEFAKKAQSGCTKSADTLIRGNLSYAYKFAKKWTPRSNYPTTDELYSCCCVGMLKALDKFDPEKGVRFITLAAYYMRAEMSSILRMGPSIVHGNAPPFSQNLYYPFVRAYRDACSKADSSPDSICVHVASTLGVKLETAQKYIHRFVHSKDSCIDSSDESIGFGLDDPDDTDQLIEQVKSSFHCLNDREKYIIIHRFLEKETVNRITLSEELGISVERVRQLENRAISKIRSALGEIA